MVYSLRNGIVLIVTLALFAVAVLGLGYKFTNDLNAIHAKITPQEVTDAPAPVR